MSANMANPSGSRAQQQVPEQQQEQIRADPHSVSSPLMAPDSAIWGTDAAAAAAAAAAVEECRRAFASPQQQQQQQHLHPRTDLHQARWSLEEESRHLRGQDTGAVENWLNRLALPEEGTRHDGDSNSKNDASVASEPCGDCRCCRWWDMPMSSGESTAQVEQGPTPFPPTIPETAPEHDLLTVLLRPLLPFLPADPPPPVRNPNPPYVVAYGTDIDPTPLQREVEKAVSRASRFYRDFEPWVEYLTTVAFSPAIRAGCRESVAGDEAQGKAVVADEVPDNNIGDDNGGKDDGAESDQPSDVDGHEGHTDNDAEDDSRDGFEEDDSQDGSEQDSGENSDFGKGSQESSDENTHPTLENTESRPDGSMLTPHPASDPAIPDSINSRVMEQRADFDFSSVMERPADPSFDSSWITVSRRVHASEGRRIHVCYADMTEDAEDYGDGDDDNSLNLEWNKPGSGLNYVPQIDWDDPAAFERGAGEEPRDLRPPTFDVEDQDFSDEESRKDDGEDGDDDKGKADDEPKLDNWPAVPPSVSGSQEGEDGDKDREWWNLVQTPSNDHDGWSYPDSDPNSDAWCSPGEASGPSFALMLPESDEPVAQSEALRASSSRSAIWEAFALSVSSQLASSEMMFAGDAPVAASETEKREDRPGCVMDSDSGSGSGSDCSADSYHTGPPTPTPDAPVVFGVVVVDASSAHCYYGPHTPGAFPASSTSPGPTSSRRAAQEATTTTRRGDDDATAGACAAPACAGTGCWYAPGSPYWADYAPRADVGGGTRRDPNTGVSVIDLRDGLYERHAARQRDQRDRPWWARWLAGDSR